MEHNLEMEYLFENGIFSRKIKMIKTLISISELRHHKECGEKDVVVFPEMLPLLFVLGICVF